MKVTKLVLIVCAMMFVCNVDVNAQTAAKAGKAIKELVKKGSKNFKKGQRTNGKKVTLRPCLTCKGEGKVNVWNQYYGYWETKKCIKCNGTGKVAKFVNH